MSDPRRGGRPPLDPTDKSVTVSFRLPSRQYDALYERARRARVDVADQIRRELTRRPPDDHDDE